MAEFPTLGAPGVVTGPEYMKALASMGYNVETMSSSLPMMAKAANAATSLMDQAYQQRLEWDKAQAANKEAIAHANDYQAEADWTNRSSDQRIQEMELKNKQAALDLDYNQYTLDGRKKEFDLAEQLKQQDADIANATFEQRKALATEQGKFNLAETQQKTQDLQSALADRQPAIDELRQISPSAPDYDQQIASWHSRHLNAINNPATQTQIASELDNLQKQHGSLISVQRTAANRQELSRLASGNHLPANMDLDSPAFINNPQKVQQALVQGHISEEVDNLNGIYTKIKASGMQLPVQYQQDWEELRAVRDRLTKTQNLEGYTDLINGGNGNGDILTPDGTLRKDVKTMVDELQAYLDQLAKRQAEVKPVVSTITTGKLGTTGPEVKTENVPAGQEQLYIQGAGEQQRQEALKLATPAFVTAHPEIRPFIQAYKDNPSAENEANLANAIVQASRTGGATGKGYRYGGRVGYQTGGEVGYGAGSAGDPATNAATPVLNTDTVPAMLTPGEFVLTKNATDAIGPGNLAQINRIADNTSGPAVPKLVPIPVGTDATVAAVSGLARPQDQIQHPDLLKGGELAIPNAQPTPESDTGAQRILSTGRLPMSNRGNYAYPEGAADLNGIDRNVWANVMSEEGPQFSMDGKHMSVFGLWQDAPGAEGQAYRTIKQYGATSLPAFKAVTETWNKLFLQKTQPQRLTSPGMQELVIADSQHAGGGPTLKIIQQMGGWDAINKMNPADAIRTYSSLRSHLWPGNSARVDRERTWALAHDSTLSGDTGTQYAGMQTGGMVAPNPNFNPAYNMQAPVQGMTMPGTTAGQMVGDPLQPSFDPSMIMPMAPQPDLTTGEMFPPPNRPVYQMQHGGEVPDGGGGAGGFEAELDQPGGGAGEGQRHRRFHPRMAGMGGMGAQPNIPDPMQKKVAKLSQDFIGGLSSMIRSRPELGGAIMQHAKNLMAATGLSDVRTGGEQPLFGGGTERQQQPMINPAMLAATGGQGSSSEESYT